MRILHVNKFLYRRGGAEGYLLDLAQMQKEHGDQVAFFGMQHPENTVGEHQDAFPPEVQFEPPPAGVLPKVRTVARMMWSTSAARGIQQVVRSFRPDVAHLHNIYHQLSPSVVRALQRSGVPMVMTMHDYKLICPTYQMLDHGQPCTACIDRGPGMAAVRRCKSGQWVPSAVAASEVMVHRRLGAYDPIGALIAPSRFLLDMVQRAGVGRGRLRQVRNFTDLSVQPREARNAAIVFAGRLSAEKGVATLIRAVGILARDRPGQHLLDIAGEGPEGEELRALAARCAPGAVRFHGRLARADLIELLSSAVVSCTPSIWFENQPLSVLESFALGVPVVASDIGGLAELVRQDRSGSLVAPGDSNALADALSLYLDDPQQAWVRGEAARRQVEQEHGPEQHLAQIRQAYTHVMAERAADPETEAVGQGY